MRCCGSGGQVWRRQERPAARLARLSCGCYAGACRCFDTAGRMYVLPSERNAPACYACSCVEERDDGVWIRGTAARYGVWSTTIQEGDKTFREVLRHGAFDEALHAPGASVVINISHDDDLALARWPGDPGARVWADKVGLHFRFRVPDTDLGAETLRRVRSRHLDGCSFAFSNAVSRWAETAEGLTRTILSVGTLHDVCLAPKGAYVVAPPDAVAA